MVEVRTKLLLGLGRVNLIVRAEGPQGIPLTRVEFSSPMSLI